MEQREHIKQKKEIHQKRRDMGDRMYELYTSWLNKEQDATLSELLLLLEEYNSYTVEKILFEADWLNSESLAAALGEGMIASLRALRNDREHGIVREKEAFIKYFVSIYKNRAGAENERHYNKDMYRIDFDKPKKGEKSSGNEDDSTKKKEKIVKAPVDSLDEVVGEDERISRGELIPDPKPTPEGETEIEEKKKFYVMLNQLYFKCLMEDSSYPPCSLALCYARGLYQIMEIPGEKERRTAASAKWAFMKMGDRTIYELGDESEYILREYVSDSLRWCDEFRKQLEFPSDISGVKDKLGNLVYTVYYNKDKIEDWAEYMHSKIRVTWKKCIKQDRHLNGLVQAYILKEDKTLGFIYKNKGGVVR